jgi:hypothetical protein
VAVVAAALLLIMMVQMEQMVEQLPLLAQLRLQVAMVGEKCILVSLVLLVLLLQLIRFKVVQVALEVSAALAEIMLGLVAKE